MITVVADFLKEQHKDVLRDAARRNGLEIAFYDNSQEAKSYLQDTEILFARDPSLVKYAPNLKWNCTPNAGAGEYCEPGVLPDDVLLSNSSGAYGLTISEHIIMVILELLRKQPQYMQIVREKRWVRDLPVRSIYGSRITILGTGDIGTQTARRLRAFVPAKITGVNRSGKCPDVVYDEIIQKDKLKPAKITGVNRSGKRPDVVYDEIIQKDKLKSALQETDILVMCLPGGAATMNYVDKEAIDSLPNHAIVVNVGRGSNIDQTALMAALNEERIAGAALDVFEIEPIPEDDPLWNCKNLLITPHISGNMTLNYTVDKCVAMFCEDLDNYCNGRPLEHLVNRKLGY